jgi:hypothetical protein
VCGTVLIMCVCVCVFRLQVQRGLKRGLEAGDTGITGTGMRGRVASDASSAYEVCRLVCIVIGI